MYEHFKKLQKYARAIHKEVVKLGHEQEDHTEVILEMQKLRDEQQDSLKMNEHFTSQVSRDLQVNEEEFR